MFLAFYVPLLQPQKKMQSTALALSPFTPFLKPGPHGSSNPRIRPTVHLTCIKPRKALVSGSSYGSITGPTVLLLHSNGGFGCKAGAASVPEIASESEKSRTLVPTLQLGSMFSIWYLLNIYYNIYNKQVLKVFPFPATITAFQFGFGTLMVILMWTLNLHKRPKLTRSQFAAILPLAVAHTLGNTLTNISLGKVAVSFTHTIKAMEPFFTVLFSALFLGERPSFWILSSLIPIVGGVALASFTEASFNWIGFYSAMASNVTNQSRNVLSKKFMINKEEALDNINLFSIMTITSFVLLTPAATWVEGSKFIPSYLQSAANQGLNVRELCIRSILAGFCFHTYQQVSYMILEMVNPITHSVGNCVKRVVVIVSAVIFFQTPVSPINSLGTAVALSGVFLYSSVKRIKSKDA